MEIVDILNKLINSERSERELGNVAAAETFAAKAQELLFKHKLTMTDLDYAVIIVIGTIMTWRSIVL